MTPWRVGLAMLMLAACATPPMLPDDLAHEFLLDAGGLDLPATGQRVDFGRTEASTVAAVSRLMFGPPAERATNAECGAGPLTMVSWRPGLTLLFQEGDFRGWLSRSAELLTTTGLSTGMTRAQIAAAGLSLEPTTLGDEFARDGVFGLIEAPGPNAPVTVLRAGVSCFFR